MQITIDGHSDVIKADPDEDLSTTIERINREMKPIGYTVETFELDGTDVWSNWREQVGDKPVSEFEQLDIKLMAPRPFCSETLDELEHHFQELIEASGTVGDQLQQGNRGEAYQTLNSIMSHLQQYIDAINYINLVTGVNLAEGRVEGEQIEDLVHGLRKLITDAEKAVKEENTVSLSDLVQYELTPLIEKWLKACPVIKEMVVEEWKEPEDLENVELDS